MFEPPPHPPATIDLSDPKGPMKLGDWLALYPTVPMRTVSLCLWEAGNLAAHTYHSDEEQNAVIVWLVAERLDELLRSATEIPTALDPIALPDLAITSTPPESR